MSAEKVILQRLRLATDAELFSIMKIILCLGDDLKFDTFLSKKNGSSEEDISFLCGRFISNAFRSYSFDKKNDIEYKDILINLIQSIASRLNWRKPILSDVSTIEMMEDYILIAVACMRDEAYKNLSEIQKAKIMIQAEEKLILTTGESIFDPYYVNALKMGAMGAIGLFIPMTGMVGLVGIGLSIYALINTSSLDVLINASLVLISIRKRLEVETELEKHFNTGIQ